MACDTAVNFGVCCKSYIRLTIDALKKYLQLESYLHDDLL